jgi:hypothetical protein
VTKTKVKVYTPPYQPRTHQARALVRMEGKEAFALFHAQRTGKTATTLGDFGRLELAGQASDFLEISKGSVYADWRDAMFGNPDNNTPGHLSADLAKRILVHVWRSDGGRTHEKALRRFLEETERPRALMINVEALSSVQRARATVLEYLSQRPGKRYGVIDESLIIGNPSSARTKFINDKVAPLCDYRRILCGLPTPRDPLQLFGQMWFLDWRIIGQRSFYAFRARYAVIRDEWFGGRRVPVVVGFRNLEELQERIAPFMDRVLLEDVYDMPPKTYSVRKVALTDEQKKLYAEMKAFATMSLSAEEHVTATIVIVQIMRLHQLLCGHVVDDAGVVHHIPTNRTKVLLDVLEEYDGKAIVWCAYDHEIRAVQAALEAEYGVGSVSRWWGGNRSTRDAEEARFKTDPNCRWMLATEAAGGRGREWSCADLVVYCSNSRSNDDRQQSEDRAQAVGKTRSVGYVDLVAYHDDGGDTVDGKILKSLREDMSLSDAVTGDKWREWVL